MALIVCLLCVMKSNLVWQRKVPHTWNVFIRYILWNFFDMLFVISHYSFLDDQKKKELIIVTLILSENQIEKYNSCIFFQPKETNLLQARCKSFLVQRIKRFNSSEKFCTNYMVFHELYLSKRLKSQKINKFFRFSKQSLNLRA